MLDEDPGNTAEALSHLGEAATHALPRLRVALTATEDRQEIALAIWRISGDTKPLFSLVRDSIRKGKPYGLGALGQMGSAASPLVQELIAVLAHESVWVRYGAAKALGKIGGPAAEEALRGRLDNESHGRVRKTIEKALKELAAD